MPRSLFGKGSAQFQRLARRAFNLSSLGRLQAEVESGRISAASKARIARLEREVLAQVASANYLPDALQHNAREMERIIQRYSRKTWGRETLGSLLKHLRAPARFLQTLISTAGQRARKPPSGIGKQEQVAIDFLNSLGYEVIGGPKAKPPTKRAIAVAQSILQAAQQGPQPTAGRTTPPEPPPVWQPQPPPVTSRKLIDVEGTQIAEARGFKPVSEGIHSGPDAPRPAAPEYTPLGEATAPKGGHEPRDRSRTEKRTYGGYPVDGTLIAVSSSNIYSIGFVLPGAQPLRNGIGKLLVRFVNHRNKESGRRPGAMYEYFDVPITLFYALMRAGSKGRKFWDRVRIRGTVSGHQYDYRLAGVSSDLYVPRKATMTHTGEFYIPRAVGMPGSSSILRSSLPRQRVNFFTRGEPARGKPARGAPRRGR